MSVAIEKKAKGAAIDPDGALGKRTKEGKETVMTRIIIAAVATLGFVGAAAAEGTPRFITNGHEQFAQQEMDRGTPMLDRVLTGSIERSSAGADVYTPWSDYNRALNYGR